MRPIAIAAMAVLAACANADDGDAELQDRAPSQAAVQREIRRLAADLTATSKLQVVRVEYIGEKAFLVTSPCCDQFNYLYDKNGRVLCAPSGGITGRGDGRCKGPISRVQANGTSK